MDPEIVGALIGPLLTAGLAGLAVEFKEWRRRRESAAPILLLRLHRPRVNTMPPGQVGAGYRPPAG